METTGGLPAMLRAQYVPSDNSYLDRGLDDRTMTRVRVCVIGMGRAGNIHAEILKNQIPEVLLTCVTDEAESAAKNAGVRLGVSWTTDWEEVVRRDDIDAVVVSVPTHFHQRVVLAAASAEKHVLVEKPLAPSLGEAKKILDIARASKLVIQVGYMRRFDRGYAEAKDRIVSGFAGIPQVYRAIAHDPAPPTGWAIDPSMSGGIFYDMLSHDIDMARHLMSSEVSSVYAKASDRICEEVRRKGDYDTTVVLMAFESGAYGYVEGLRKSPYGYDLRTEVVGSEGSVVVGAMSDPALTFADNSGIRQGGASWFAGRFQEAFVRQDTSFVKSILANRAPEVSVVDGFRTVEVAEACKISVKEKRPVTVAELH